MRKNFIAALAAPTLILCLVSAPVVSQESVRPPIEIMPFGGFRLGGEFEDSENERDTDIDEAASYGFTLRVRPNAENEWELLYSRQATETESEAGVDPLDVDIEYLHIGGTYFPSEYSYAPYVLGGLGVTRLSPKPGELDDETAFSMSLGAGMRFPITEHFALRLEGRAYATFLDTDSAIFCASDGGGACAIRASSSTFLQFEGVLGFAFWF